MQKMTITGAFCAAALLVLTGCEQQGPAERAGEKVDEAVQDSQNKVEDVVESAGDQLEQAGDKIQENTQ